MDGPLRRAGTIATSLARATTGLYAHRLWSSLSASGVRVRRDEIAVALLDAQMRGEASVLRRLWSAVQASPSAPRNAGMPGDDGNAYPAQADGSLRGPTAQLLSVKAAVSLGDPPPPAEAGPSGGELPASWDLFRRLLPYYAECARIAAGTGLTQFPERHRVQFQLLRPDAPWWPRPPAWPVLTVTVSDLDPGLLQALFARRGEPVFVGYPTEVVTTKDGTSFIRPIAVLRADWERAGDSISFRIADEAATFNPDWLSGMRRNRRLARVMDWLGTADAEPDDGVLPVTTSEWTSMEDLARTLGMFLAADMREALDPGRPSARLDLSSAPGVFNALGIYLVQMNNYTAGIRRDLAALASWSDADLERTALSALFGASRHASSVPVLPPLALEEDQVVAVREALSGPLTVITGPPGTGKSQAAAAIMASAALSGRSALFSSRHHQALDAVDERFRDMMPDRVVLARARQDRETDFDFRVAIDSLLARHGDAATAERLRRGVRDAAAAWDGIDRRLAAADRLADATAELAAATEALREAEAARPDPRPARGPPPPVGILRRLLAWLGSGGRLGRAGTAPPTERSRAKHVAAAADRVRVAEAEHRRAREGSDVLEAGQPLPEAMEALRRISTELAALLPDALEATTADERERLAALRGDLGLSRDAETARRLWSENADLITRHFPLWAVTALSVPSRIPLQPALFDYAVLDEATTCDIAAAIPVLARARHAIVIGDPMQTGLVGDLPPSRENPILERAGLRVPGIGRYAYTQTSVFDLASTARDASRHMLRDHFRCHPDIAGFVSDTFYGRRLTVLTDERRLRPPSGVKPGLHWTDTTGPVRAAGRGCISEAEAEAIAAHLHDLLVVQGYEGTVGVVTPFKKQAEAIRRLAEQRLPHTAIERSDLRVATGHAFQGDARDVILVSPCFAVGMPQGAAWFVRQGASLFNVAVSRARAVCHVFGDIEACRSSDVRHLSMLARRVSGGHARAHPDKRPAFESPWEERLHDALVARGLDPIPQYPLAGRRLDLALIRGGTRLDVEVDGEAFHRDPDGFRKVSDVWRDHQVRGLGWKVLRFWVYELREDMERCVDRIVQELG